MFQRRPAANHRSYWPAGPLPYTDPALAAYGPALPPVTRADARAGLRFQDSLVAQLRETYPRMAVCPDWWFEYNLYDRQYCRTKTHKAGPDILLLDPVKGLCIVIECKLTYTDAYKQLFLYMSLLRSLLPHPHWTVYGFLAYQRPTGSPVIQAGPSHSLLNNPIELDRFKWTGHNLPTIGAFGRDFIPVPRFTLHGEPLYD